MCKYFGAEVGALTTWDEKADRYIVNGVHDADKLQVTLDGFINRFVLCSKCKNPETVLTVKNGIVERTCKACGAKTYCDNNHKLATYIKNNPPPKPVKLKQARDVAADNVQVAQAAAPEEAVEGMVAPEGFDDGLAEAVVQVDEDDWDEAAAQANRESELAGLSERVKNSLALKADGDFQDPLEAFADYIESRPDLAAEQVLEEIAERGIRSDKAVAVLTQILLEGDLLKQFKARSALLAAVVQSEKDRAAFLGSLDRLICAHSAHKQTPALLQAAYMAEVVDEGALAHWKDNPSKKYIAKKDAEKIRAAAAPFFAWLEEDDEDDEEDDDE